MRTRAEGILAELVRLRLLEEQAEAAEAQPSWPRAEVERMRRACEAGGARAWAEAKEYCAPCGRCGREFDQDCWHVVCPKPRGRR